MKKIIIIIILLLAMQVMVQAAVTTSPSSSCAKNDSLKGFSCTTGILTETKDQFGNTVKTLTYEKFALSQMLDGTFRCSGKCPQNIDADIAAYEAQAAFSEATVEGKLIEGAAGVQFSNSYDANFVKYVDVCKQVPDCVKNNPANKVLMNDIATAYIQEGDVSGSQTAFLASQGIATEKNPPLSQQYDIVMFPKTSGGYSCFGDGCTESKTAVIQLIMQDNGISVGASGADNQFGGDTYAGWPKCVADSKCNAALEPYKSDIIAGLSDGSIQSYAKNQADNTVISGASLATALKSGDTGAAIPLVPLTAKATSGGTTAPPPENCGGSKCTEYFNDKGELKKMEYEKGKPKQTAAGSLQVRCFNDGAGKMCVDKDDNVYSVEKKEDSITETKGDVVGFAAKSAKKSEKGSDSASNVFYNCAGQGISSDDCKKLKSEYNGNPQADKFKCGGDNAGFSAGNGELCVKDDKSYDVMGGCIDPSCRLKATYNYMKSDGNPNCNKKDGCSNVDAHYIFKADPATGGADVTCNGSLRQMGSTVVVCGVGSGGCSNGNGCEAGTYTDQGLQTMSEAAKEWSYAVMQKNQFAQGMVWFGSTLSMLVSATSGYPAINSFFGGTSGEIAAEWRENVVRNHPLMSWMYGAEGIAQAMCTLPVSSQATGDLLMSPTGDGAFEFLGQKIQVYNYSLSEINDSKQILNSYIYKFTIVLKPSLTSCNPGTNLSVAYYAKKEGGKPYPLVANSIRPTEAWYYGVVPGEQNLPFGRKTMSFQSRSPDYKYLCVEFVEGVSNCFNGDAMSEYFDMVDGDMYCKEISQIDSEVSTLDSSQWGCPSSPWDSGPCTTEATLGATEAEKAKQKTNTPGQTGEPKIATLP